MQYDFFFSGVFQPQLWGIVRLSVRGDGKEGRTLEKCMGKSRMTQPPKREILLVHRHVSHPSLLYAYI